MTPLPNLLTKLCELNITYLFTLYIYASSISQNTIRANCATATTNHSINCAFDILSLSRLHLPPFNCYYSEWKQKCKYYGGTHPRLVPIISVAPVGSKFVINFMSGHHLTIKLMNNRCIAVIGYIPKYLFVL